ncbi:hypothetical protein V1477_021221 [Vespula maculifrons]|uniref:Uncharacterized protein n=1 Tax=Vespula maculifrons TaxID=7453 RepID=A0ABD2AGH1_VESMC
MPYTIYFDEIKKQSYNLRTKFSKLKSVLIEAFSSEREEEFPKDIYTDTLERTNINPAENNSSDIYNLRLAKKESLWKGRSTLHAKFGSM